MNESQKKNQIVLVHSSRKGEDYLKSIEFRLNGEYDKIPHYFIYKNGDVIKNLDDNAHSKFFDNESVNKNSIIICLENLGWLKKDTLSPTYSNWIGTSVDEVKEKRWRAKYFWDFYTDEQTKSLVSICNKICEEHNIPKKFIGNNTRIPGSENFRGILTRSNFNEDYTDLSPAFNFVYLLENFNYD